MLSGGTYLQINFGNLTLIETIQLTVPAAFAPILYLQLGYSWDGISFAIDTTYYFINGSSSYIISLPQSLIIQSLRIYLIDVVYPSDLLTKTSGFILNITGAVNSTTATLASKSTTLVLQRNFHSAYFFSGVCPSVSNTLLPRTILVAPPAQLGLTYANDVYVCDETPERYTRTKFVISYLRRIFTI